ncbi:MAG: AAA family ATPase [Solirubrobacteraceae bacterium]|nr:AAA family ATPase [Solirubrobacteraceae bacterium]
MRPTSAPPKPPDERELGRLQDKLRGRIAALEEIYTRAMQATVAAHADIDARAARRADELRKARQREVGVARDRADRAATQAQETLRKVSAELAVTGAGASWTRTPAWKEPPDRREPAAAVRIGHLHAPESPMALVPGIGCGHVVGRAAAEQRETALGVIETIVIRTLASAAPGAVRFRVFDPVGLGASLGSLSRFDQQRVAHGPPLTGRADLADALEALTKHATTVSSVHLQGRYASLREYAATAGDSDLHYELLCLLDAPRGLDADTREQVSRLGAHASDRGIMLIVHEDAAAGAGAVDVGGEATQVDITRAGRAQVGWLPGLEVELDPPPLTDSVDEVSARAVAAPKPLEFADLHVAGRGTEISAAGLSAPLGRAGSTDVSASFDDETAHALIAGNTGSGKSNLLRTLVYGLARRYSPEDLRLYLLDFKEGVEFQEFAAHPADMSFLPHADVVSVNSSREFGVAVLEHVNRLIADRYQLFNTTPGASKLAELRELRPDLVIPRVLLVIDEFQRLFDADDDLGNDAVEALLNIAKQGRAAGVHFALATQSIGDVGVGTQAGIKLDGVFKNAPLRVGMRLSDDESRAIFRPSNTAAAEIQERGIAIVNAASGADTRNQLIKVAYVSPGVASGERREAVARVRGPRRPPRVFNGGRGAEASANWELQAAARGKGRDDGVWRSWVGASLRIDAEDPQGQPGQAITLGRDGHRNLAIVGAGTHAALGVLQWTAIGLASTPGGAHLVLVDLTRPEDVVEQSIPAGVVRATAAACRARGATVTELTSGRADELLAAAQRAHDAPEQRTAIVIFGVERIDGLDDEVDNGDSYMTKTMRDELAELIAVGPRRGTHTLAWWPTVSGYRQFEPAHDAFGMHVYLGVPESAMLQLAGRPIDPSAEPLAVWHDVARSADPVRFHTYRPFGAAETPAWLA